MRYSPVTLAMIAAQVLRNEHVTHPIYQCPTEDSPGASLIRLGIPRLSRWIILFYLGFWIVEFSVSMKGLLGCAQKCHAHKATVSRIGQTKDPPHFLKKS